MTRRQIKAYKHERIQKLLKGLAVIRPEPVKHESTHDQRNQLGDNLDYFQLIEGINLTVESDEAKTMGRRISVFDHDANPHVDKARFHYTRSMAKEVVDKGLAVWVHKFAIQRRPPGVRIKDADSEKNMLVRDKTSTSRTLYFDANQQRL